jgi:CheY-like chemotaxis protein
VEKPFVLIADDNEATCTLLIALLRNDFTVEIARDGNEAIAKLTNRRYATVLLDLLMPRSSGYDVLDFVKSDRPDMLSRILVVTASLTEAQLQRVRTYDICGIIAKPFDVEVLLTAVKKCAGMGDGRNGAALLQASVILLLADLFR